MMSIENLDVGFCTNLLNMQVMNNIVVESRAYMFVSWLSGV